MSSGSSHSGGSKQVYKVKIFNQIYSIASSASEAEFQQIADHVDHLMQTIASRAGTADGARVGVMAAMHLADRLRQAERRLELLSSEADSIRSRIDERAGQLDRILQEALEAPVLDEPRSHFIESSPIVESSTGTGPSPADRHLEEPPNDSARRSADVANSAEAPERTLAETSSPDAVPRVPAEHPADQAAETPSPKALRIRRRSTDADRADDPGTPSLFSAGDWQGHRSGKGE